MKRGSELTRARVVWKGGQNSQEQGWCGKGVRINKNRGWGGKGVRINKNRGAVERGSELTRTRLVWKGGQN